MIHLLVMGPGYCYRAEIERRDPMPTPKITALQQIVNACVLLRPNPDPENPMGYMLVARPDFEKLTGPLLEEARLELHEISKPQPK